MIHEILKILDTTELQELEKQRITTDLLRLFNAEVPDHGMCKERNCNEKATKDYNGHQHYVCDYHHRRLNDYFDEGYR